MENMDGRSTTKPQVWECALTAQIRDGSDGPKGTAQNKNGSVQTINEPEAILRILGGEQDLFAELVREHQVQLYQLCLAFLQDPHDADEATQVVFIKAYRSLGNFRGGASFKTWLTRIGINQCKDVIKNKRRRRTFSLDVIVESFKKMPDILVAHPEQIAMEVKGFPPEIVEGLSEGERQIVEIIRCKDEIRYEEIAQELGLSVDAVKGRLKRARVKMQENMRKTGS